MGNFAPARSALRRRQGAGARSDAPSSPARELGWARLRTAYFARILHEMKDEQFDEQSRLLNISRRRIVARIALEARLPAEMIGGIRGGKLKIRALNLMPCENRVSASVTMRLMRCAVSLSTRRFISMWSGVT